MKKTLEEYLKITSNLNRPNALDYIEYIFSDFIEMHGDRLFGDDESIVSGIGLLNDTPVTILAQLRGKNIADDLKYHHSMNYPEGYRKALRAMKQAEKFNRPIVCFIDTVGAFPGDFAEERGQSNAIAMNLMEMMYIKVPIISVLIGTGGSGGALALSVADKIIMLEYSTFGIISPKACANILWKDPSKEIEAAKLLKLTSDDLKKFGVVDKVISESGGAHNAPQSTARKIKSLIIKDLKEYKDISIDKLLENRYNKFRHF